MAVILIKKLIPVALVMRQLFTEVAVEAAHTTWISAIRRPILRKAAAVQAIRA